MLDYPTIHQWDACKVYTLERRFQLILTFLCKKGEVITTATPNKCNGCIFIPLSTFLLFYDILILRFYNIFNEKTFFTKYNVFIKIRRFSLFCLFLAESIFYAIFTFLTENDLTKSTKFLVRLFYKKINTSIPKEFIILLLQTPTELWGPLHPRTGVAMGPLGCSWWWEELASPTLWFRPRGWVRELAIRASTRSLIWAPYNRLEATFHVRATFIVPTMFLQSSLVYPSLVMIGGLMLFQSSLVQSLQSQFMKHTSLVSSSGPLSLP